MFIANCPRCSMPINKILIYNMHNVITCECKSFYFINMVGNHVEWSCHYRGCFIFSSERVGETAFRFDDQDPIWIKRVFDPITSDEQLDKILLLI